MIDAAGGRGTSLTVHQYVEGPYNNMQRRCLRLRAMWLPHRVREKSTERSLARLCKEARPNEAGSHREGRLVRVCVRATRIYNVHGVVATSPCAAPVFEANLGKLGCTSRFYQ